MNEDNKNNKIIDHVDLHDDIKELIVIEAKAEAKKELVEDIKNNKIEDIKIDTKKFILKSKIFWINFLTIIIAILPDLLSALLTNVDFASMLKEYNTKLYMVLFVLNAYFNIYFRMKNQDKITIRKSQENDKSDL